MYRKTWTAWWPVALMLLILSALGYPLALLFGLPLARRDKEDLRKWLNETVLAQPVLEPAGLVLEFPEAVNRGLLVRDAAPLGWDYQQQGNRVSLSNPPSEPLLQWQHDLSPHEVTGVYQYPESIDPDILPTLYRNNRLLLFSSLPAREIPDGQRLDFSFLADEGRILLDGRVLQTGEDYHAEANRIILQQPAAFSSNLRRINGDVAVLDAAQGLIAFNTPPAASDTVRSARSVVRLAEQLEGALDGENRLFQLARPLVMENDRNREIFLNDRLLSDEAQRPEERVDGQQRVFHFPSATGIVVLEGQVLQEGRDYSRQGQQLQFQQAPARNARLRQHPDFFLQDPRAGELLLSVPPAPEDVLWAQRYRVHSQPSCGTTVLECFFALPQHPVPFPHWIVRRIPSFLGRHPLRDERNVLWATIYTSLGTLAALALGGAVGIVLAVLFVLFRPLERALLPWAIASQTIPIIALVPVMLLVLGNFGITIQTSMLPTALIGAYIAFFPVVVGTVKGLRSIDPLALDLMRSYAASPLQVFLKLRFPAALPFFFTSLKLGTAAALVGALVAETESNNRRGLGFQILGQVQSGNVADVWILLLISALLGIGLVAFVGMCQRLLAPWQR